MQEYITKRLKKNTITRLAWNRLCKIIVVDDEMMIDKRTDKVLGPEVY